MYFSLVILYIWRTDMQLDKYVFQLSYNLLNDPSQNTKYGFNILLYPNPQRNQD